MRPTELLIGYGSLLSKKGITREGTAPPIRRAWAVLVPGRRGFAKTFREGRKAVMDAFLDEAKVLHARPLDGFLEGPVAADRDVRPDHEEQPAFEAMGLEVDADGWTWFDAREEFPAGLGDALAAERDATGRSIGAILATVMAEAGLEAYPRALHARYETNLQEPDWSVFAQCYIPYPLHLPDTDTGGAALPHEWGIICATPEKRLPCLQASDAAARPGIDADEILWYYHDCVLGAVHGIDVSDVRDEAFEAARPDLQKMLDAHRPDEARPLAWFLGNIPKGALPSTTTPQAHGMRPLEDLVPLAEAERRLAAIPLRTVPIEPAPLDGALDRVLAEDVHAPVDVPAFDKSAMDGYAVSAEDTFGASIAAPRRLRCIGVQHAGPLVPGQTVTTGTCVQIATGAPLPAGADAVVMVEATRRDGETVLVHRPHARRQNVVGRASDIARGDLVVRQGTRLDPVRIAALAAVGVADLRLYAHPRVAVLSTGDEVVPPGRPLGPGEVHDANNHALAGFCRRLGCHVTRVAGVPDVADALEQAVERAAEEHDLVIVTGGTSAGARDLLPGILAARGEPLFHGIRIRPGKPVVAARLGGRPVIGLPGYPTSCLLVAERLLAPLLARLGSERRPRAASTVQVPLAGAVAGKRGWDVLVPVRIGPEGAVPAFRGSAAVTSLSQADGYIEIGADADAPQVGARVTVRLFR